MSKAEQKEDLAPLSRSSDEKPRPIKKESCPGPQHIICPSRVGRQRKKKVPNGSVKGKGSGATREPVLRQRTLNELFVARRSTRKCKTVLESEKRERIADKLRDKIEEGLKVVEVEDKGRGVVTTRPFSQGELICEYSGVLLEEKEAENKEEEYLKNPSIGCYMYFFTHKSSRLCIDATEDNGRMGRLLNHSKKNPNVYTKIMEVDDHPYLCLMAKKDVEVGEELQYDYGEKRVDVIKALPWLAS